jgi:hypothetical protein
MDAIYEEEYKDFTIKIIHDDMDDDGPRSWDNAGKMVCWHNRYNLGDEQPCLNPDEWLQSLAEESGENCFDDMPPEIVWEIINRHYVILPLYLYDHSGISISTSHGYPYNDRWDAGQVGWIYISKLDAVKEWGKKLFTKTVEQKTVKYLQGEVETYNDYLTGNVYGFQVCESDEDGEVLESCWGFYPEHDNNNEPDYQYCLTEAMATADYLAKDKQEKQDELDQRVAIAMSHSD